MKIVSWNVNEYRFIWQTNFEDGILQMNPDILCLQETNTENIGTIKSYKSFLNCSLVSERAGVGIYLKKILSDCAHR